MARFDYEGRGEKSDKKRLAYATLLVLVVFALDLVSGGSVRGLVQTAGSSIWGVSERIGSALFDSGYFESRRSLEREIAHLREQLSQNTERSSAYQVLAAENAQLRSLLSLAGTEEGITAPIVSSVRSSPYGTFLIGAGTRDNISQGSLVLTEGGFVVGRVTDVGESVTLVTEIFAGGAQVDAAIGGSVARAEGRGGGNARVSIPRGIEVQERDAVTAPQFSNRPIGIVGRVESDTSSADQTVYVHLPVNLSSIRFVFVVPVQ